MKFRLWVKVSLALISIIAILMLLNKWTDKEVNQCIESGNTEQFCKQAIYK